MRVTGVWGVKCLQLVEVNVPWTKNDLDRRTRSPEKNMPHLEGTHRKTGEISKGPEVKKTGYTIDKRNGRGRRERVLALADKAEVSQWAQKRGT